MARLKENQWTGNVRELEQILTRQALMEENPILEGKATGFSGTREVPDEISMDRAHRAQKALAAAGGNKTKAAEALGISRKTLYFWLKGEPIF